MIVRNELLRLAQVSEPRNYAVVCFYLLCYPNLFESLLPLVGNSWETHRLAIRIFTKALTGKRVRDWQKFSAFIVQESKAEVDAYLKSNPDKIGDKDFIANLLRQSKLFFQACKGEMDRNRFIYAHDAGRYDQAIRRYLSEGDREMAEDAESIIVQDENEDVAKDRIRKLVAFHATGHTFANEQNALRFYKDKIVEQGDLIDDFITDYFFEDLPSNIIASKYQHLKPSIYAAVSYGAICRMLWDRWPLHIILFRLKHKKAIKARATAK